MFAEKEILALWEKEETFKESVDNRRGCKPFIIYEGPPTANGKPGIHHVLTRSYKDMIARFWTMNDRLVERRAGWDEHGLPVEIEVQKMHNLHTKQDIINFGIDKFNAACAQSTQKNIKEWEELTLRMGYWIDLENAYRTSDPKYIDKVWDVFKELHSKNLIYRDNKIVPWAWDSETAVSNSEVAQGYKEVTDQSAYVLFKTNHPTAKHLVAWTTTPWTLPGNTALAINKDATYKIYNQGYHYTVIDSFETPDECIGEIKGHELEGVLYQDLFDYKLMLPVVSADFVKKEKTGIVHIAPAFGQDDYSLYQSGKINRVVQHVDPNGKFNQHAPEFLQGKKVASKTFQNSNTLIINYLKDKGKIWKTEEYKHQYPHNWRTGLPLIYLLRPSYYVATNAIRSQMIEANKEVNWFPEHIKEGRFGTWLEGDVDWAVSRERFWGTPLPIYNDESFQKPLHPHKPEADEPLQGLNRDNSVLDCWFDSGSMPFAAFEEYQQADVICEAIDQTRGWFYTLMVLGTALKGEAPYKNVVCLSHILDKDGQKMSKSKGNVVDPMAMFEKYGADSIRWYMVRSPIGNSLTFNEADIKFVVHGFMNRLWDRRSKRPIPL